MCTRARVCRCAYMWGRVWGVGGLPVRVCVYVCSGVVTHWRRTVLDKLTCGQPQAKHLRRWLTSQWCTLPVCVCLLPSHKPVAHLAIVFMRPVIARALCCICMHVTSGG